MKKSNIIVSLLFMVSIAQAQVFMTKDGELEILGLKNWEAQTLIDSMKTLAKGAPIHACASQMVHDFGFSEVSVTMYPLDYSKKYYTVVCIIENNEEGKLKYLQEPADSLPVVAEYAECAKIINKNYKVYYIGLQSYQLIKQNKIDKAKAMLPSSGNTAADIDTFWTFLKSQNKISDMNLALWVLNNDSNLMNRSVALAILTNFDQYDAVWWEIMNLQRTENGLMRFYANMALQCIAKEARKVDWEPAAVQIKYLLNGTNLFYFNQIVKVFIDTEISPKLSKKIISGSTDILNLYLDAEYEKTREVAIDFIRQISGNEELKDAAECRKWLSAFE